MKCFELLNAAKDVIAQFRLIQDEQRKALIVGQTFESASRNWEQLPMRSIDFDRLMRAVVAFESRSDGR